MKPDSLVFVPLDVAITPCCGEAIVDHYWVVHPEKGAVFFNAAPKRALFIGDECILEGHGRVFVPQCNADEKTAQHLNNRIYPDCETRLIACVFAAHAERIWDAARAAAGGGGNHVNE